MTSSPDLSHRHNFPHTMTNAGSASSRFSGSVAVLGGSGFIGTRLVPLLREEGRQVLIGDFRPSPAFPDMYRHCDVRDLGSLQQAIAGMDAIINLAAEHRDDVRPLSRYREVNVEGAAQVCRAACEAGIQKIVFTSSVAVYGFQPKPVDEAGPFAPFNEYGKTKLEAEQIYRTWADEDPSRSLTIVRPTVVFGEGNRGNVYNLLQQIATGRFMMVGSGSNIKSMAYVGNVAAFLAHALTLGSGVHIFNYVDGPDMTTLELVEYIRGCLGANGRVRRIPRSIAMAGGYMFDIAGRLLGRTFPVSAVRVRKFCETTQFRADRVLLAGFIPPFSLADGLARTIRCDFLLNRVEGVRESGFEM